MVWPVDKSKTQLIDAMLTFKEIHGDDAAIHFLEQELTRECVIKQRRVAQKQTLLAAPVVDTRALDLACKALQFYGEESFYETSRGKKSQVATDGGEMARETLAQIAEIDENGSAEGDK